MFFDIFYIISSVNYLIFLKFDLSIIYNLLIIDSLLAVIDYLLILDDFSI